MLNLFSFKDDIVLHVIDIAGVNLENWRIFIDNLSFDVPVCCLGNFHDDFFAELRFNY